MESADTTAPGDSTPLRGEEPDRRPVAMAMATATVMQTASRPSPIRVGKVWFLFNCFTTDNYPKWRAKRQRRDSKEGASAESVPSAAEQAEAHQIVKKLHERREGGRDIRQKSGVQNGARH
jgi:hypothetical protein